MGIERGKERRGKGREREGREERRREVAGHLPTLTAAL